ncbi:PH domain-containing protein [Asanoa hainanensis]|uniref:PH domain-containing protein n=1 Tax=Asanoa hainanensis TaxID=560556 RepID=A0A239P928_9ACTN|nr:PH domain-containing protein [Asanoa hainanensis]SNT63383.1 PH domain-containing protein [Asanoa hainanensis]
MIDGVRVFRSRVLFAAGCVMCAVLVTMWTLSLIYGDGSFGAMMCPLGTSWLPIFAWFGTFRPRLIATPTGVTVVEPLRTTTVPWDQIRRFDSLDVLHVHRKDGPSLRVTSLSTNNINRAARREGHADRVARDLNVLLARHRGGRAPRITTDTEAGRTRLRLNVWHAAYPVGALLFSAGSTWGQLWLALLGPLVIIVATVVLRRRASARG